MKTNIEAHIEKKLKSFGIKCQYSYDFHWKIKEPLSVYKSILEMRGKKLKGLARVTPNRAYTETGYFLSGMKVVLISLRGEPHEIFVVTKNAAAKPRPRKKPLKSVNVGDIVNTADLLPTESDLSPMRLLKIAEGAPCELYAVLDDLKMKGAPVSLLAVFKNKSMCRQFEDVGFVGILREIKNHMKEKRIPGFRELSFTESGLQGERYLDLEGGNDLKMWIRNKLGEKAKP